MTYRVFPAYGMTGSVKFPGSGEVSTGALADVSKYDAAELKARGFFGLPCKTGTTANRPPNPKTGDFYGDTTTGTVVIYNGNAWVDAITGA